MKRLVLDFENENDLYQLLGGAEADERGNRVLVSLRNGNMNGVRGIVVKEEYLVADLDHKLQALKDGLESLTRAGFSVDLLKRYLHTRGVSYKTFDLVMSGIKEFFYQVA